MRSKANRSGRLTHRSWHGAGLERCSPLRNPVDCLAASFMRRRDLIFHAPVALAGNPTADRRMRLWEMAAASVEPVPTALQNAPSQTGTFPIKKEFP